MLDRRLLAVALVAWCVALVIQLAMALPFGHDEAAYALGAERLLAGDPWLWVYRSVGLELLAVPAIALGGDETAIRLVPALLTLTVPTGAYMLARVALPEHHLGGWCALALAGAHPMVLRSADYLGDLPSAGMILLGLALLVRELERPGGATWRILGAAPLLAAAFYLRYGNVPALAAIALATPLLYRRAIARRPSPIIALAALAAAFAVPHIAASLAYTGRVLGILDASAEATDLAYVGEGLVTYLTTNPVKNFGVAIAPLLIAGLVTGVAVAWRPMRLLLVIALAAFLALGLRSHAQPRFVFVPVSLLVILGVTGFALVIAKRRALIGAAIAVLVACAIGAVASTVPAVRKKRPALELAATIGRAIARDAANRPCVLDTFRLPQLAYYSGCMHDIWPDAPRGTRVMYHVSLPSHPIELVPSPTNVPLSGVEGVTVEVVH